MKAWGAAIAATLAFALLASPASALTFTVNTEKDLLDAEQTDGLCAAANGKCSLRAATMAANGNPGFDQIEVPKGVYELTQPRGNSVSSLTGDLDLDEAVSIAGAGSKKTIIRQTVKTRVIRSNATSAGIIPGGILADLTVTGGNVTQPGNQLGGGILVNSNYLLMDGVVVRDNRLDTGKSGGANTFGGGIAVLAPSALIMQQSKVSGNTVKVRSETASAVGGGIFIDGEFSSGSVPSSIVDSQVVGNVATVKGGGSGTGGGIYMRSDPVSMTRVAVSGNKAQEGGGITITQGQEMASLDAVTVERNKAVLGAGISVNTGDPVTVVNSTIAANKLVGGGGPKGGAALASNFGTIDMSHVTIAGNKGGKRGSLRLNSSVAGGVVVDLRAAMVDGPKKDCVGNELGGLTSTLNVFGDTSCTPGGLSDNVVDKPELRPLASNPGVFSSNFYGRTRVPKPSSPAINFVTSGCPPPAQDQLGLARPAGLCDAGAVERP